MKNRFPPHGRLYPAHYALLYLTAGDPLTFFRPKIPAPRCRYCDGYVRDYGGYTRYIEEGINLSDIWDDVSPVRHKPNKHRSANQRSSPELCVKVRGSSSMLLLGCLGDLLRFEKREIQVATFAPGRSSP